MTDSPAALMRAASPRKLDGRRKLLDEARATLAATADAKRLRKMAARVEGF